MNILMNLLSNSGYIIVNKEIIKKLGLHEAIILGELCSEYTYWEKANQLNNGFFYSTRENIERNTGLTPYQQREPLKKLVNLGIVLEKMIGMPCQKWYSLDLDKLYTILNNDIEFNTSCEETLHQDIKKLNDKTEKNLTSSYKETFQPDVKKLDININNKNNNKNNNKDYMKIKKRKDKVFLSDEKYDDLVRKIGKEKTDKIIERLDLYKKSTGKSYSDDYATLLLWIENDTNKSLKLVKTDSNSKKDIWINSLKEEYGENLEGLYANFK